MRFGKKSWKKSEISNLDLDLGEFEVSWKKLNLIIMKNGKKKKLREKQEKNNNRKYLEKIREKLIMKIN